MYLSAIYRLHHRSMWARRHCFKKVTKYMKIPSSTLPPHSDSVRPASKVVYRVIYRLGFHYLHKRVVIVWAYFQSCNASSLATKGEPYKLY